MAKPEIRDEMKSPVRAKHINDGMFIEDVGKLIAIIAFKDQRENVQIIDNRIYRSSN